VIDDGSEDNTFEYLNDLKLPITVIRKTNGGVSSARNLGIVKSTGEIIAFLDSDDLWLPEKLECQVEYLINNSKQQLVYCDEYIEVNGQIIDKTRFERSEVDDFEMNNFNLPGFVQKTPIHTSSVLIKKDILSKAGLFNETLKIHEDSEFWNRLSMFTEFGYIKKPLAIFRFDDNVDHLMKDFHSEKSKAEGYKYLKIYEDLHKSDMTDEMSMGLEISYGVLRGD